MKKNLITAVLMTLVTTVLFGLLFPLLITGLAKVLFPSKANGELLTRNGKVVGSRLIGQSFSSPGYFTRVHPRRNRLRRGQFQRIESWTYQPIPYRAGAGRC